MKENKKKTASIRLSLEKFQKGNIGKKADELKLIKGGGGGTASGARIPNI